MLNYWFRHVLNFNFSEKGLGLVASPHFVNNFSKNIILMLHSINWSTFIVWLPLLLQILKNIFIRIVCWPGYNVIIEINLIFLIKPFWYMIKKSRQNLKYLENKKSFWGDTKSTFQHFESAFNCQKLSQTWECVFKKFINLINNYDEDSGKWYIL